MKQDSEPIGKAPNTSTQLEGRGSPSSEPIGKDPNGSLDSERIGKDPNGSPDSEPIGKDPNTSTKHRGQKGHGKARKVRKKAIHM